MTRAKEKLDHHIIAHATLNPVYELENFLQVRPFDSQVRLASSIAVSDKRAWADLRQGGVIE